MIIQLATKYSKPIAVNLFLISYIAFLSPSYGKAADSYAITINNYSNSSMAKRNTGKYVNHLSNQTLIKSTPAFIANQILGKSKLVHLNKKDIGGPSQPEMSTFKSIGVNNLVNTFTGDFNYNIPLLDVEGYPVNLFYNAGISPEQEAGWVGLGWNLNPGNINRNMRGIPDDFDGTDTLIQKQNIKPNNTWGINISSDAELCGFKTFGKLSSGMNVGISFNNYLGPALDFSESLSIGANIADKACSEKSLGSLSVGLGVDLNSRSGLTLNPSVSLLANAAQNDIVNSFGLKLNTSYNSRSGIKALELNEQVNFNKIQIEEQPVEGLSKLASDLGRYGTTISFVKPSYIPSIRMPVTNTAFSGRIQIGGSYDCIAADAQSELYCQKSYIAGKDIIQYKPMVGYLYYEKAVNNPQAVMDMTRFNDQEVTPNTPVISVPQYTYDVFNIQGEGTGGSVRAYRNEYGYVRDNFTQSREESSSLGFDFDIAAHYGGNILSIHTPSTIGDWTTGNILKNANNFGDVNGSAENVFFRNPGETSVIDTHQYDAMGGTDLVRFQLAGEASTPLILPTLQRFNSNLQVNGISNVATHNFSQRTKRGQVISFLTADQTMVAGLDKNIKSYNAYTLLDSNNNLLYDSISRVSGYRKGHHISEIDVTETNGKRYIYGIPVYNVMQQDFTFSVAGTVISDADHDKINVTDSKWMHADSSGLLGATSSVDGSVQETITPAYAHSFLLSGLLSPDYVDVTGDGITPDDLGTAIKFNYTRIKNNDGSWNDHQWRTPLTNGDSAHLNPGKHSEIKDDKGIISYGVRESWYLHSIESKNLIAVFHNSNRYDGKGPADSYRGGINQNDSSLKKLDRIDLYNKADLKVNGIAKAKPIKSVLFSYSYTLCQGSPDNPDTRQGKLTLDSIYFIFNGQNRNIKNKYAFSYVVDAQGTGNPAYMASSSDRWGTFKPSNLNPSQLPNSYYPYGLQDSSLKSTIDQNAGAWSLKKILLPSGGQIEVNYESDDYAYVQNKRADEMMHIVGFGNSPDAAYNNQLYAYSMEDNYYIFIRVPQPCHSSNDVYQQYLQGNEQGQILAKLAVNMPKGNEYINSYFKYISYGVTANQNIIWFQMKGITDNGHTYSPLVLSVMEFLRQQLPGQAFTAYDVSNEGTWDQMSQMLEGMLQSISNIFSDPISEFKSEGHKAQQVNLNACFVRLNSPNGFKYGGGHRVKSVILKDNWDKMAGSYLSTYGQQYNYTTTEVFNGQNRTISSGVASYEPSIGGDENPFQYMVQVEDKVPLGPASFGAVEMPVMDAFFTAPVVGYSKVTVTSIQSTAGKYDTNQYKSRSGIGKQVTQFYTAKDYPVYYANTSLDPASDIEEHKPGTYFFLHSSQYDYRTLSQGFLVATNDMHGKLKSQSSYAANDTNTLVNYTENFYRNTGTNGLNEMFNFVSNSSGGQVKPGNMGIDIELMTDVRQFTTKSNSTEHELNVDIIEAGIFVIPIPTYYPVTGNTENTYRAVTTTKVINYHAVLDSVVVIDKGSQVSTKNLVYDAETGSVIVSRANNEFNQAVYNTSYPAYWAYSGMGPAYKNVGAVFNNLTFSDGRITNPGFDQSVFESGDELLILNNPSTAPDCHPATTNISRIWAYDTAKNTNSGLTNSNPHLIFIDSAGNIYSNSGVSCKIIRSGHRNMLDEQAEAFSTMASPIVTNNGITSLVLNNSTNVISSTATEYKEKWQTDRDVFVKDTLINITSPSVNLIINGDFSQSNYGFNTDYVNAFPRNTDGDCSYRIVYSPNIAYPASWVSCSAATTGVTSGLMMAVNGSVSLNSNNYFKSVWNQTVYNIQPNTLYEFSFWVTAASPYGNPAKLLVKIDNIATSIENTISTTSCLWTKYSCFWNSGNSSSAFINIVDENTEKIGNDFALTGISFQKSQQCQFNYVEVPTCTGGYWEKHINPYLKGIMGNFKAERSWVFYGSRNETNPTVSTNISANGYLANFNPFWNFNSSGNLTFNTTNTSWVWNNMITRTNAKGLELETKNALNIYTAGQYGYNKTLPVAITNNSQYNEMFAESFEDSSYNEYLNVSSILNCANTKFINLGSLGSIRKTDSLGFNAHSGKYVLEVVPNPMTNMSFLMNSAITDFNAHFKTSNIFSLINPNLGLNFYTPDSVSLLNAAFYNNVANSPLSSLFQFLWGVQSLPDNDSVGNANYKLVCYMQAPNDGIYTFNSTDTTTISGNPPNDGSNGYNYTPSGSVQSNGLSISIYDQSGTLVNTLYNAPSNSQSAGIVANSSTYLAKGIYKLEIDYSNTFSVSRQQDLGSDPNTPEIELYGSTNVNDYVAFNITTLNCNTGGILYVPLYATNNTTITCTSTVPIPANDSMMNPSFTLTPGKKMWFSSWVRENCNGNLSAGIPCTDTTYTHGSVQIGFNDANSTIDTLLPSGPIIDGWQKIEGAFTVPQDATSATLSLLNSNIQPIYFDDIRIHPFNADMKSYVYDPVNLRLAAELDANNYATYYEYDEEGTLIRTKVETQQGIKTINETHSAKQKNINNIQ